MGEQVHLGGVGLFLDLHELSSQLHGTLRGPFGVTQGGVKDLVAVALQVGLDVPKIVTAIFGVPIRIRENPAIALMKPVEAGDAVD